MAAAFTFAIAFILLAVFLAFRFWEERRGRRVWGAARDSADVVVVDMYSAAVMGNVPQKYRIALVALLHAIAHEAVVSAVRALQAVERPLARLSHRLRQSAPRGNGKEPSAFLKTITPEKRSEYPSTKSTDSL